MPHNEEDSRLLWRFAVDTPGTYTVQIDFYPSAAAVEEGAEYLVEAADQRIDAQIDNSQQGPQKAIMQPGKITLSQPGEYTLEIRRKHLNQPHLFAVSNVKLQHDAP